MELRLNVLLVATALASSACLVVGNNDDNGGGPSSGGNPSTGGSPSVGGSPSGGAPSVGGGVEGGGGSTGNQGGGPECQVPSDCPTPEFYCTDQTCPEGVCGEELSEVGTVCGDNNDGLCDAEGFCVECLDDNDCPDPETCDDVSGTCVDLDATGPCANSFCLLLPANGACANCLISAGQGTCQTEFQACNADGTDGSCTTCIERVQGENGAFCAGSQGLFNDYYDCICASGVCLD